MNNVFHHIPQFEGTLFHPFMNHDVPASLLSIFLRMIGFRTVATPNLLPLTKNYRKAVRSGWSNRHFAIIFSWFTFYRKNNSSSSGNHHWMHSLNKSQQSIWIANVPRIESWLWTMLIGLTHCQNGRSHVRGGIWSFVFGCCHPLWLHARLMKRNEITNPISQSNSAHFFRHYSLAMSCELFTY